MDECECIVECTVWGWEWEREIGTGEKQKESKEEKKGEGQCLYLCVWYSANVQLDIDRKCESLTDGESFVPNT